MVDLDKQPCCGRNLDKLIQPAILVHLAEDSLHGYALVRRLEGSPMCGGTRPDPAGVYRYLKTMEQRGLVSSAWEMGNSGPPKKLYRITDDGMACLERWIESLREYRDGIEAFLAAAEALPVRRRREA